MTDDGTIGGEVGGETWSSSSTRRVRIIAGDMPELDDDDDAGAFSSMISAVLSSPGSGNRSSRARGDPPRVLLGLCEPERLMRKGMGLKRGVVA